MRRIYLINITNHIQVEDESQFEQDPSLAKYSRLDLTFNSHVRCHTQNIF